MTTFSNSVQSSDSSSSSIPTPASLRTVPDRICIVMLTAVGDAVHTLPIITALKRANPRCKITWILQPGPATLVRGHPDIDEIIVFDRSAGWRGFLQIREVLAKRTFDLVLDLQVYLKASIVTAFTPAPVKLGFDRGRARDGNWLFTNCKIPAHPVQHMQDQYFEFLDYLGVPYEPIEWNLGPWSDERAWQTEWRATIDRPIASIVVATSKPQKDWIPERWAEVCDALYSDYGLQPVLVGGQSSREVAAEQIIQERTKVPVISMLGSGLRKLVGILDASALVLAPDTGPLHMAIAIDRPSIALMGYTNPKRTGPYRKFHDLLVDAYANPGEVYEPMMENRRDRMPNITVSDVLERVERWKQVYS